MSEADFYGWWKLGYTVGLLVVAVVAALLITILVVARRIRGLAATALATAGDVLHKTRPIWSVSDANAMMSDVARSVASIDSGVASIASALEGGKGGAS